MILRAAQHRRMPWKNGGGETTEIAVFPEGAGLDDFQWRVSMARVSVDGPFSAFPGVDRTLAIVHGDGLRLQVGDDAPRDLRLGDAPLVFAADRPTQAWLLGAPVLDLNVMTRRGAWTHEVQLISLDRPAVGAAPAGTLIWLLLDGAARLRGPAGEAELAPGDAWLLAGQAAAGWSIEPAGAARLARVLLAEA